MYKIENIWLKGYIITENQLIYDESAKKYLLNILIRKSNNYPDGFYSFVAENNTSVIFRTDHAGSIPIFYTEAPNFQWAFNPYELNPKANDINDEYLCELLSAGYVTGSNTVYKNIKETLPLTTYIYNKNSRVLNTIKETINPFYIGQAQNTTNVMDLLDSTFYAIKNTTSLPDINLSLSSGLDSRIIFAMLIRHNIKFKTFTYGTEDNIDYRLAGQISKYYGIKHISHNYIDNKKLIENKSFLNKFVRNSFLGRSLPHEQDYISSLLLDKNSLFIGGHSGDFAGGSYITPLAATLKNANELCGYIFYNHAMLTPSTKKLQSVTLLNYIKELIPKRALKIEDIYYTIFVFNHINRQRRYILNSVRAYESEKIPFFLPLYTKSFLNFFTKLPIHQLEDQRLYKEFATDLLFTGKLSKLKDIEITRPLSASFKKAKISNKLFLFLQLLDSQKLRKLYLSKYLNNQAANLRFIFPHQDEEYIFQRKIKSLFSDTPKMISFLAKNNCPNSSEKLKFVSESIGAQLNTNGFYILFFMPYILNNTSLQNPYP